MSRSLVDDDVLARLNRGGRKLDLAPGPIGCSAVPRLGREYLLPDG